MRKLRTATTAMLVLIAATACQPQYVFFPITGGNDNQGTEPTISSQEEFEAALNNGEAVVLPVGTFTLPKNVTRAIDITGTDGTELTISFDDPDPTPVADVTDGIYDLPAGSSLKDLVVVFSADGSSQITTYAEPGEEEEIHDPAFAMLIQGGATIDNVTFQFPEEGSLSGINVYQASGAVSLSDITIIGNPRRAPINISGSNVNLSGEFAFHQIVEAEAPQGWYGKFFAVQVNGTNTTASTVSFDNATGIHFVYQEWVGTPESVTEPDEIKKPGNGQTQVAGFNGKNLMLAMPTQSGLTPAGWVWLNEGLSDMVIPLYFTAPAHVRFFNALNSNFQTVQEESYDGKYGIFGSNDTLTGTLADGKISYNDIVLNNYMYNNTSSHLDGFTLPSDSGITQDMLNARATGTIDVEFTVSETGTDNPYKATDWKISGQNVVLSYAGIMYVIAEDFEISGEFGTSSSTQGTTDVGPLFTVTENNVSTVDQNGAAFYVAGATGSATINGSIYTNISELATDDCSELLDIVKDALTTM